MSRLIDFNKTLKLLTGVSEMGLIWHLLFAGLEQKVDGFFFLAVCIMGSKNFPFQTVKKFLSKLSKISFPNCQNFPFQTVKISLFKLSKFPFPNCQNYPFQTVKNFLSKLSKLPFPNCQNYPFQTVNISLFKTNKFCYPNLRQPILNKSDSKKSFKKTLKFK